MMCRGGLSKPRFFELHFVALPGTYGFALARAPSPGSPGAAQPIFFQAGADLLEEAPHVLRDPGAPG